MCRKMLDLNANLSSMRTGDARQHSFGSGAKTDSRIGSEELDELVWNVAYVVDLLDNKLADEFIAA